MRAWEPFEAVALGASVLSAERFQQSDVIFHDYAFLTRDPDRATVDDLETGQRLVESRQVVRLV